MDLHPTPFPGKNQSLKPKTNGRSSEKPKMKVKESLIHRGLIITSLLQGKESFGTARNPNVPAKTVTEKPRTKPLSGISRKLSKPSTNASETPKKPSEEKGARPKKNVNFQDKVDENKEKILQEADVVSGAQTPLRSPFSVKPRALGTPFLSAERCSKCRFDKLETSSYWLAQIKLAESVGKHFVSAAFFKLALECGAEPFRNIKVELKKYLTRHEYLSAEKEWKDLSISYGLPKDESKTCSENGEEGKIEDTTTIPLPAEEENIMEQVTGEPVAVTEGS